MSLIEVLESIRQMPVPTNEDAARNKIVNRILAELGWDMYSSDVDYQYLVGDKKNKDKVDIALMKGKNPVTLIEAKSPDQRLESHVNQVLRYAFHEGVDICALTTGLEWWLYLPREKGPPAERRFTVLNVKSDQIEQIRDDLERFLGRENLLNGEAEKRAKQVLDARREADHLNTAAPQVWRSMLKKPDAELVDLLSKRIYDEVGLRPTPEQAKAVLQELPISISSSSTTTKPSRPLSKSKNHIRFLLFGEEYYAKNHREILKKVAESLHEKHPVKFDRLLTMHKGKHPYVSRNREDIKWGRVEIGSEYSKYYIYANFNINGLEKRARLFLEVFGYSDSDLKILDD